MTIDIIFTALTYIAYFAIPAMVLYIASYFVLFAIYKLEGGKKSAWQYLKWYIGHK